MKHKDQCSGYAFDNDTKTCKVGTVIMAKRNSEGEEFAFIDAEIAVDNVYGKLSLQCGSNLSINVRNVHF